MSLDGLRDAYIREKKNEIATCELSRKRKLRELYNVNALLTAGLAPQNADWLNSEPSENERRFLDANDITKGLRFDDSTLPYPVQLAPLPSTLPFQSSSKPAFPSLSTASPSPIVNAPISLEEQLRAASASPSVANQPSPAAGTPVHDHATPGSERPAKSPRLESVPQVEPEAQAPVDEEKAENDAAADISAEVQPSEAPEAFKKEAPEEIPPDGPSADPKLVVPPSADDTGVPANTPPPATVALEEPKRPQVVHLPPQEVQEARLKEREKHLEQTVREQERKEDERLAIPVSNTHTDLVSSPSSTIGPYSQATPHATHQSPDTSPDGESFVGRVAQSIEEDLEPDPAARQAKEEHERALQKQMQEARERARGDDSATPEVERQLEEEQAIRLARDGKSRLSESDPTPVVHSLTEHAEDVVRDLSPRPTDAEAAKSSLERRVEPMPTPTIAVPEPSGLEVTNADTVPENRQRPTPATVEHPTPPADVDVEMDDAAPAVKERPATPRPAEPSPQECPATPAPSEVIMQKSTSGLNGDVGLEKAMPTPRSSNVSASPPRPSPRKKKSNEVSTVIFAKRDPQKYLKALQLYNPDYAALQGASEDPSRDYLQALFQYQAHHAPRSLPLSELVSSARKTVSTGGVLAMLREVQDYKILKRVYHLQNANRWSLRQLQKSAEPPRPSSHLDHLLREMKWLQTDFKEERKWKKALAATFAEWCAEYVNSSPEEQASLRIRARAPSHRERLRTGDDDMLDAPTPDLVHSGANETESESFADDEELFSQSLSKAPAGLFSLGFNDVVVKLDSTPATDAMLLELPAYEPNLEGSSDVTPVSFCDPPILPVSKFVTGKLVSKVTGPPRKRSRYEYDSEDEPTTPPSRSGTSAEHSMPSTPGRRLFHRNDLPPELTDVALFNPDNKHVRDRLYAAHQFKPPSEFPMPSVSFFENRTSSQWLWSEDQQLRALVKEYAFNWSLVAQELSQPSKFVSGAGRRTPWECFERWVQLEGLPSDMGKTPYFRTYQTRLEQAQRTVVAQHQAQQQLLQSQAQQGQNVSGQARRRVTHPIRVERRRDNRHLAIIDGMRKLAKRREQQAHKQSEAQKAAAMRKAHEPVVPKANTHTPQEFSRAKWEKEEKHRQMREQYEAQMKAQNAQRQAAMQGMQGQSGMPNMMPTQRNGPGTPGGLSVPVQMANSTSQPGHMSANPNMGARQQHPGQQAMAANFPNGNLSGMPMNASGVPQAQMQATMQNNQRMPPPDQVRMAMQRAQYPATNQHHFQMQQQQLNMSSNLGANMNMANGLPNANMMASMANPGMSGNMNASMNGTPNTAGSPRMNQVNAQMQSPARPLSSGHMPHLLQIQNSLKALNPDWTTEQVQKTASDQLSRHLAKQRAQALGAATGAASGMTPSPQIGNNVYLQSGGMQATPPPNSVQTYQNQLLQQQRMLSQQRQQQAPSPAMSARPMSRSATPQNPQQQQGMQSPNGPPQMRP